MAKGYWMVHVEVDNAASFSAYVAAVADVFKNTARIFWRRLGNMKW